MGLPDGLEAVGFQLQVRGLSSSLVLSAFGVRVTPGLFQVMSSLASPVT
jgi:hypothetical protein